jgi:hypothetical protein
VKVSVTQTGGPLGVPLRHALDSAHLSQQDAAELTHHARAVAPAPEPERTYPGELGYTVRVEPDDGPTVEASYADGTMPDDVRRLVTWVQGRSGKTRYPTRTLRRPSRAPVARSFSRAASERRRRGHVTRLVGIS